MTPCFRNCWEAILHHSFLYSHETKYRNKEALNYDLSITGGVFEKLEFINPIFIELNLTIMMLLTWVGPGRNKEPGTTDEILNINMLLNVRGDVRRLW